ncbi:protein translocase subunit SecF [Corynebacterium resistens]|uniref:protein translocase subunit SecF n=1 Tax=Corynebacterium resistens TaxID=258224 RepID=UPI0030B7F7F4
MSFFDKMYNGMGGFQIIPKRRKWYTLMAAMLVVAIGAILIRGFTLGIDFQGGTRMAMPPADNVTQSQVEETFEEAIGVRPQSAQTVGSGDSRVIEVTSERLSDEQIRQVRSALFEKFHPKNAAGEVSESAVTDSTVSESWGKSITQRMLLSLGVFLLIVFAYITVRLERDMALAAIVTILLDLAVVAGLYALIGFEVSPATVIGLLTILAFSLYDVVVVFDKIRENTAGLFGSTRSTFDEQANLALNQTIMRSINTSIFSAVPIVSLLVVAVGLMGVGTLKDLALVQFIGVIVGTFNSIFFAAPLLASIKARQRKYRDHNARVLKAREGAVSDGEESGENGAVDAKDDAARNQSDAGDDGADHETSGKVAEARSSSTEAAGSKGLPSADEDSGAASDKDGKRKVRFPATAHRVNRHDDDADSKAIDSDSADFTRRPQEPGNGAAGQTWRPGM